MLIPVVELGGRGLRSQLTGDRKQGSAADPVSLAVTEQVKSALLLLYMKKTEGQ